MKCQSSKPPARRPKPTVPDSGYAWVVLVASFGSAYLGGVLVYFVGVIHVELLRRYRGDVTSTAWAGSLYSSLQMLSAPLASWIVHRHSCRASMIAGGILLCVGFFWSAFATSVIQLMFTYGLIAGVGLGLIYSPTLMIVTFYFDKHRALASGVSVSGAAIGILSGSLMTQAAIDHFGLSGAFLLIAGFSFNNLVFGMLYRPTHHEGRGSRGPDDGVGGHALPAEASASAGTDWVSQDIGKMEKGDGFHSNGAVFLENPRQPFEKTFLVSADADHDSAPNGYPAHDQITPCLDQELRTVELQEPGTPKAFSGNLKTSEDGVSAALEPKRCSKQQDSFADPEEAATRSVQRCADEGEDKDLAGNVLAEEETTSGALGEDAEKQVLLKSARLRTGSDLRTDEQAEAAENVVFTRRDHGGNKDAAGECLLSNRETKANGTATQHDDTRASIRSDKSRDVRKPATSPRKTGSTEPSASCCFSLSQTFSGLVPLLKNKPFLSHCVGVFLHGLNLSGVYLHLPGYARANGTTPTQAAALFVGVGTLSLVSRLSSGLLLSSRRVDALVLSACLMGTCGAATSLFPAYSATYLGQMAFACLFGLSTGGINTLINVLNVELVGFKDLAASYGLVIFMMGSGYVVGPPLAGATVDWVGTYEHSFIFLGLAAIVSAAFDILSKVLLARQRRDKDMPKIGDTSPTTKKN